MSGIEYASQKAQRAKFHLDEFNGKVEKFLNIEPYAIRQNDHPREDKRIITIEHKPIPYTIALLLGEFAYSLRSGLDNLAWHLALMETSTPFYMTCFPIYSKKRRFESVTKHIPKAARDIMESLQPYSGGTAPEIAALSDLDQLCNSDKHRVIPISSVSLNVDIYPPNLAMWKEIEYGMEVTIPLSSKDDFKLEVQPPSLIIGDPINTSGEARFEFPRSRLTEIHDLVSNRVIPRFKRFFP